MEDYKKENNFFDKKNELWYEKQGDYYLPCLELLKGENEPIGILGERHLRYLKQHRKVRYYINLLTSGKLNSLLAEIDKQAERMCFRLVKELAEQEGVTETLLDHFSCCRICHRKPATEASALSGVADRR